MMSTAVMLIVSVLLAVLILATVDYLRWTNNQIRSQHRLNYHQRERLEHFEQESTGKVDKPS